MKKDFSNDAKVGLFVVVSLIVIAFITIKVGGMAITTNKSYMLNTVLPNAEGITDKTQVQVAGIPIGVVDSVELAGTNQARLKLKIRGDVKVNSNMVPEIRTRGVLGDTYIELVPDKKAASAREMKDGEDLPAANRSSDYQEAVRSINDITSDLKEITEAIKVYTISDQSRMGQMMANMQNLSETLLQVTNRNVTNVNAIVENLAALSADLRAITQNSTPQIQNSLQRIDELTQDLKAGQGTVGRLLKDGSTIDKANEILDNVGDITRGYASLKTQIGYHLEYLANSGSSKSYVTMRLQPRPDKFFQFDVVHDPHPPASRSTKVYDFDVNGFPVNITQETAEYKKLRFSAQLGRSFDDFTVRGGLIESTGGFGVDYNKGPVAVRLDAFSFGEGPHLKATTELNVTNSLYLLGGVDDFVDSETGPDWFFGAGIRFTEDDVSSLLGAAGLLVR